MAKQNESRHFETLFVIHPDHGARAKEFVERFKKLVEDLGATVTGVEEWGIRDLAYRIHKQRRGYYNLLRYRGQPEVVQELERQLKITDGVIRHMTVRLEEAQAVAEKKVAERPAARRGPDESTARQEAKA